MSGIPSHNDDAYRQALFDYSRNETYGKYTNMGQHAGVINNYQSIRPRSLEELRKRCSPSAAFNSAARFDPPRCAESTRQRIIQAIEEWINGDEEDASVFWLYGGAGAGKSALAQSLSEKFQRKELAASFFFFRGDSTRNNGDDLIPTLVSQLVSKLKGFGPFVEDRITENWDIFTKGYDIQIQELLVEPLLSLKSMDALVFPPRLVVIDGLDECTHSNVQCLLLRAIARALPHIPYPLRFLVTSRPEAHIAHVFNHEPALQTIPIQRYNLSDDPDADMDIRIFLEKEFVDIRKVHRLGKYLPLTWPGQKAISSLVERSSGHFIYASTVVRYVQSPKHRPDDRMEVILRLRLSQEGDKPYAQLDALYGLIFGGVESRVQLERICLVLGILYFQSKKVGFFSTARDCTTIEKLLGMKLGDLVLLLDPILSLVAIDGDKVRIYHKSLFDYLLDFVRRGHLPFDLHRVHETVATYILTGLIAKATCALPDFWHFAFHCQYGYLNDTLKDYLFSLDVPCPKFLMKATAEDDFPLHNPIWHFLRTLARLDLDQTGRVYEEYLRKWITYLQRSPFQVSKVHTLKMWLKRRFQRQIQPEAALNHNAKMIDWKVKLDKLLAEWRPKDSEVCKRDVHGIVPKVRLDSIKQEHRIFSAGVKASYPSNPDQISSVICGDDLIHAYIIGTTSKGYWHMTVHSYSRHGIGFSLSSRLQGPFSVNIVGAMRHHLNNIEKLHASDHYISYGVEND